MKVLSGQGASTQLPTDLRWSLSGGQLRHALEPNLSQDLQLEKQLEQMPGMDSKVPSSQAVTHLMSGVSL